MYMLAVILEKMEAHRVAFAADKNIFIVDYELRMSLCRD